MCTGLIILCGPTATGKSGLAISLAQRLHSVIFSADSRQVYRQFDIGTAKPSLTEQQLVPHYLIDICDPTETMTVAEYQEQAEQLIARFQGKEEAGKRQESGGRGQELGGRSQKAEGSTEISLPSSPPSPPLLVGGTGLYIRAIAKGLKIPRVPPHQELRTQLQQIGQTQCYAMLQQIDPISAAKIHSNDAVRTLRSLEVFYVTGLPISQQQGENPPAYPILHLGLDCADSDTLRRRIEFRTGQMVEAGLAQEVKELCQKYGEDLPLLNTLGYAEFKHYLAGDWSLAKAIEQTVLHTRQFAKRQRTWFRAYPEIEWFDADAPDLLDQVWQRIQAELRHS
jgi:tRNA dimethylallyltransferase